MGKLFDILKKVNDSKQTDTEVGDLSINLEKHKINLDKTVVKLEKETKYSLSSEKSKVVVVLDYSYSMHSLYAKGEIQDVLCKLFPIALKLDDNGEMEVYLFQNTYYKLESLRDKNYSSYVTDIIKQSNYNMGGTSYSPVIEAIIDSEVSSDIPTLVIFITDGENSDKQATDKILRQCCKDNLFIQFIGIGNDKFSYLEKLDTLDGRAVDNTSFVKYSVLSKETDEKVYTDILLEYIKWRKGVNK